MKRQFPMPFENDGSNKRPTMGTGGQLSAPKQLDHIGEIRDPNDERRDETDPGALFSERHGFRHSRSSDHKRNVWYTRHNVKYTSHYSFDQQGQILLPPRRCSIRLPLFGSWHWFCRTRVAHPAASFPSHSNAEGRGDCSSRGLVFTIVALSLPVPTKQVSTPITRLDDWMPAWQFDERHTIHVDAPPEKVFAAIRAVRADEIRFFRTLIAIRRCGRPGPESILNAPEQKPLLDVATETTFIYLADEPPRELVLPCAFFSPPPPRPSFTPSRLFFSPPPSFPRAPLPFLFFPRRPGWVGFFFFPAVPFF